MPEIDPEHVPDLPIAFMNADHAREVALVNGLEAALAEHVRGERSLEDIVARLSVLAVHTRDHFLREEAMMREARFPAYATHKAEHDRVLAEMDAEARLFRQHGDAARLSRYLFDARPEWYVSHTRTMDVAAARFVAARAG
jgi:hemerythrin